METETVNNELDELMSSFKEEIEQSRSASKKSKRFDIIFDLTIFVFLFMVFYDAYSLQGWSFKSISILTIALCMPILRILGKRYEKHWLSITNCESAQELCAYYDKCRKMDMGLVGVMGVILLFVAILIVFRSEVDWVGAIFGVIGLSLMLFSVVSCLTGRGIPKNEKIERMRELIEQERHSIM